MLSRLSARSLRRPSTLLQRVTLVALERPVTLRSAAKRGYGHSSRSLTQRVRQCEPPILAVRSHRRSLFQQSPWRAKNVNAFAAAFSSGPPPGRKRRTEDEEDEEDKLRRATGSSSSNNNKELPTDAPRSRFGQILMGIPVLGALFGKSKYVQTR